MNLQQFHSGHAKLINPDKTWKKPCLDVMARISTQDAAPPLGCGWRGGRGRHSPCSPGKPWRREPGRWERAAASDRQTFFWHRVGEPAGPSRPRWKPLVVVKEKEKRRKTRRTGYSTSSGASCSDDLRAFVEHMFSVVFKDFFDTFLWKSDFLQDSSFSTISGCMGTTRCSGNAFATHSGAAYRVRATRFHRQVHARSPLWLYW